MKNATNLTEAWLNETHLNKIAEFTCIDQDKNNHVQLFLQDQAVELMDKNLVRTRLFFDQYQNLIGFYSLFNDTIKMHKNKRKQLNVYLPQNVKEIPAIRLHYIGIDDRYKGRGYGHTLMASVIVNCANIAKISGCALITVESTKGVKSFYEKYDFKYIHPEGSYYIMAMNTKNLLNLV